MSNLICCSFIAIVACIWYVDFLPPTLFGVSCRCNYLFTTLHVLPVPIELVWGMFSGILLLHPITIESPMRIPPPAQTCGKCPKEYQPPASQTTARTSDLIPSKISPLWRLSLIWNFPSIVPKVIHAQGSEQAKSETVCIWVIHLKIVIYLHSFTSSWPDVQFTCQMSAFLLRHASADSHCSHWTSLLSLYLIDLTVLLFGKSTKTPPDPTPSTTECRLPLQRNRATFIAGLLQPGTMETNERFWKILEDTGYVWIHSALRTCQNLWEVELKANAVDSRKACRTNSIYENPTDSITNKGSAGLRGEAAGLEI